MIEDYLAEAYKPIKAVNTLLEYMYYEAQEDGIFSGEYERKYAEKHMSLLFCAQLVVKYMVKLRKVYYRKMIIEKYRK
ncbi:hypothetical protein J6N69_03525 [bacterium]|nr:hypothetical protein [bacterium]